MDIETIFKMEGLTWKSFNILLIDDEPEYLTELEELLSFDFSVSSTIDPDAVIPIVRDKNVSVVISDQRMPKKTGTQVLAAVKREFPNVIRILMTGYADHDATIEAINSGEVYRYISKKAPTDEKVALIKQAIEVYYYRDAEVKRRELDKALLLNRDHGVKDRYNELKTKKENS